MQPTIGRIVYYKTRGSLDGQFPPTVFAAIVTAVADDTTLSLCTFGPSGIRFEVGVKQGQEGGQWDWMPFQKDQQARYAATPANGVATTENTEEKPTE